MPSSEPTTCSTLVSHLPIACTVKQKWEGKQVSKRIKPEPILLSSFQKHGGEWPGLRPYLAWTPILQAGPSFMITEIRPIDESNELGSGTETWLYSKSLDEYEGNHFQLIYLRTIQEPWTKSRGGSIERRTEQWIPIASESIGDESYVWIEWTWSWLRDSVTLWNGSCSNSLLAHKIPKAMNQ